MNSAEITLAANAALPACDSRLCELLHYWRSIYPASGMVPGRKHFDPIAVSRLLPWIWLIDVHRNPLRFKYRLIGTVHVDMEDRNQTGRWLDEAHPHFVSSSAFPQFTAVAERGEIAFYRGPPTYVVVQKSYLSIERLILPLAANGRDVDMLLGITVVNP